MTMHALPYVEKAVKELSPAELTRFRKWFARFDAAQWDRQFEEDVRSGKLDAVARKALRDKHRATPL
jgi:hypothetical protein